MKVERVRLTWHLAEIDPPVLIGCNINTVPCKNYIHAWH